jgi:signal transduction histidine kinase
MSFITTPFSLEPGSNQGAVENEVPGAADPVHYALSFRGCKKRFRRAPSATGRPHALELTNAAKHAGASEAHVALPTTSDTVTVEFRDNGGGGAKVAAGSGIRGLADRVEALGGRLELYSPAGAGTVVTAELPLR